MTAAVVLLLLILPACLQQSAAAAPVKAKVRIAFSKDSCWYRPGDTMKLKVTLNNPGRSTMKGVSIRLRVHVANTGREELDDSFAGRPRKSYKQTDTFGPFTLLSGNNVFELEEELKSSRYSNGVYPLTIEVLRSGEVLTSVVSETVVMSLEQSGSDFKPLQVSWVFDTLELPHRGPGGIFTSEDLAMDCDPSGGNPGWYPTLLSEMEKWQDLRFSLILSPLLIEDMRAMAQGYLLSSGRGVKKVPADSRQAQNASVVLSGLGRLSQSPRYQLIPAPYASPDLERMVSLGWTSDASQQLAKGHHLLEEALEAPISGDYVCPPGQVLSTRALKALGDGLGANLLLSPLLLDRSREGRALVGEATLCTPVKVSAGRSSDTRLAVFSDRRMDKLLGLVSGSGDPHGVAQCIISELTNLYLENPGRQRSCVVVSPGSWHPGKDVLDELLKALDSAPWIKTVTLAEAMSTVKPVDSDPIEIPDNEDGKEPDEYISRVQRARSRYEDYRAAVLPGNQNLSPLLNDLFISESDVWWQWKRMQDGYEYSNHVIDSVAREFSKVEMPAAGNITLTSASAKIPLSVVNTTGYRVKAKLVCASNGLEFPSGASRKILLEPKENLIEVPVNVRKKGRVRFTARLESNGTVLSELEFSVLTSRFNSFAIVLVAGLLALIGLFWAWKAFSRRKVGKHKRRQVKQVSGRKAGEASI